MPPTSELLLGTSKTLSPSFLEIFLCNFSDRDLLNSCVRKSSGGTDLPNALWDDVVLSAIEGLDNNKPKTKKDIFGVTLELPKPDGSTRPVELFPQAELLDIYKACTFPRARVGVEEDNGSWIAVVRGSIPNQRPVDITLRLDCPFIFTPPNLDMQNGLHSAWKGQNESHS